MRSVRSLVGKTPEEICEFLLNNKTGDAVELSPEKTETDTGFTNETIYKDKNIEIIYSYLVVGKDDIIEQFFIYSKWWGKIKNSHFTLDGNFGKFTGIRCGVLSLSEIKDWKSNTNHSVNNRNIVAAIEVTDFQSFTLKCQKIFKDSPRYGRTIVLSQEPHPLVQTEIIMPDGKIHKASGKNKREAANNFALNYKW
jgi:hypothetical protein